MLGNTNDMATATLETKPPSSPSTDGSVDKRNIVAVVVPISALVGITIIVLAVILIVAYRRKLEARQNAERRQVINHVFGGSVSAIFRSRKSKRSDIANVKTDQSKSIYDAIDEEPPRDKTAVNGVFGEEKKEDNPQNDKL